jgi:two-component system sensor histidine kinase/response regulator
MISKDAVFLVVDDISAMRNSMVSLLRGMEIENVLSAGNGKDALQIITQQRVDIVLSDWNMPVMSGLELLKAVRGNPGTVQLPFVMITAEADHGRISEAIAAGVSDLLVKPYTSGQLVTRIERALSNPSVAQKELPPAVAAVQPEAPAEKPTVLVVDDTPANLQLLYELLKGEFEVRTASNGQKALDICQSDTPPDLVLLDIMMPGMDGFEVAQRLREHPSSETIPVIFVTAKSDQESRLKGLGLGAVDFVAKPVDPEVLLPRVRNFMRYVTLHKQLQSSCDAMMDSARLREDVEQITRHDLRGPLANVVSMAQLLAGNPALNPPELELANLIAESALQVLDMINFSSELFKIESGRFELSAKPVPLGELLRRIVQTTGGTYASKEINLALEASEGDMKARALGDAAFCHSIFQNLIKNACEAAPKGTRVTVGLTFDTASNNVADNGAQVIISNSGAMPAAIRERFFEKFATSGKTGGSGLGAYSAKLLTEAQGGRIVMSTSDQENRTVLTVTLPKAG